MIKSLKFDEYRNITEIEFESGVPVRLVLEALYELGIKRRPEAGLVNVRSAPDDPQDSFEFTYQVGTDDIN